MSSKLKGSREWRVTLATKWAYLDHLSAPDIVDKFDETHGIDISVHTVRDYLKDKEAAEVEEQITEKHANARIKIAEREEQKHRRARADEELALEDEPIIRVVPKTDTVSTDRETPMSCPAWEIVEPEDDDWPEWATDRDVIIRFDEDRTTSVMPGGTYPLRSVDGSPRYTKEFDGLERDQPELQGRSMARREQSSHLENMGSVLGVYEETINLDVEEERSISEEDKGEIVDAIESLRGDD